MQCFLFFLLAGKCGIRISGDIHYRVCNEDRSLRFFTSSWCLPPKCLEHIRFYHSSHRVSTLSILIHHASHERNPVGQSPHKRRLVHLPFWVWKMLHNKLFSFFFCPFHKSFQDCCLFCSMKAFKTAGKEQCCLEWAFPPHVNILLGLGYSWLICAHPPYHSDPALWRFG